MVRPPVCVPLPIVEEAVTSRDEVVADTPAVGCVQASYAVKPEPVSVTGDEPKTSNDEQETEPEHETDVVAVDDTVFGPVAYRRLPVVRVVDVPNLL